MFDDTPEVKGSNAWWRYWFIGTIVPFGLVIFSIYSFATAHSYTIALTRWRSWFVPVFGFQATLMALAYLGIAICAFAFGFLHYHRTLSSYSEPVLALGLLPAAIPIFWCSMIFITG